MTAEPTKPRRLPRFSLRSLILVVAGISLTWGLTATIGVSDSLEGNVLYGPNNATAITVASTIQGRPVEDIDEIGLYAFGELANLMTGNASIRLAADGFSFECSPPVMIVPAGSRYTTMGDRAILITSGSQLGELRVRIDLCARCY